MAAKKTSRKTKTMPAKSKAASAKSVVKKAQMKARGAIAPVKKLKSPSTVSAWPQAMSAGGAVTTHATTKAQSADGATPLPTSELNGVRHHKASPARTETASTWLAPWGQISAAATQLLDPDAVKSAMDRQFQFYQTMARFSPLSLALQMMQGLLPAAARSAPSSTARRT